MIDKTTQRAYAKINIGLDVLRRRADGYHEVKMIMQTVDIYDELVLEKRKEPGIELRMDNRELPSGGDNLICRAADLLFREKKITGGVNISLTKRIPIAAGMAGGSADAAIQIMKGYGCKNIKLMVLVAAPKGIEVVTSRHPDVDVYCGAVDQGLNENSYIVPGLGDAGDRIFGTK